MERSPCNTGWNRTQGVAQEGRLVLKTKAPCKLRSFIGAGQKHSTGRLTTHHSVITEWDEAALGALPEAWRRSRLRLAAAVSVTPPPKRNRGRRRSISISEDAYRRLKAIKANPTDSFTTVICEMFPSPTESGADIVKRIAAAKTRQPPAASPFKEYGVTEAEVERRARKDLAAIRKERAAGRFEEVEKEKPTEPRNRAVFASLRRMRGSRSCPISGEELLRRTRSYSPQPGRRSRRQAVKARRAPKVRVRRRTTAATAAPPPQKRRRVRV